MAAWSSQSVGSHQSNPYATQKGYVLQAVFNHTVTYCPALFYDGLIAGATGIEPLRFVPNQELMLAIGFLAILGTVAALGIQTVVQARTTPIRATTIFALEPVFAAFFGRVMLAERMESIEILGASVIVVGVLVSQLWGFLSASVRSRSE